MSISLSVSKVETAVLEGMRLEEMITKVAESTSGRTGPAKKKMGMVKMPTKGNVKEEKKPPREFRNGPGLEEAAHPSTYKSENDKSRMKTEGCKHGKEAVLKTEVTTYTRMATPPGIGDAVNTRFTFARQEGESESDEEEHADHGDSDGEGGEIPCAIPDLMALRPLNLPSTKGMVRGDAGRTPSEKLPKGDEHRKASVADEKRGGGEPRSYSAQETKCRTISLVGAAAVKQG